MKKYKDQGIAVVSVLIMMVVLMAILTAYFTLTLSELKTGRYSLAAQQGFYAAEGGLNLRAELVRATFVGYQRPVGNSPTVPGPSNPTGPLPCTGSNLGSGDFICTPYTIGGRTVRTYVTDITKYVAGQPETGTVQPGDVYVGLNYQQYAYRVQSDAYNTKTGEKEASLFMNFQSRLVPLFQFAAFYTNDLEFHPGPPMTLNGRVHTNANLFLNSGAPLTINGKTTAGQSIYRFGKDGRSCDTAGSVVISSVTMPCKGASRDLVNDKITGSLLTPFNKNVLDQQQALTVPTISSLRPDPANELWSKADLRIVAYKNGSTFSLQVVNADKSINYPATLRLAACNPAPSPSVPIPSQAVAVKVGGLYDGREQKSMTVIEVDQKKLMDCIAGGGFTNGDNLPLTIDDATGGGLVWNFSFGDSNAAQDANINGTTAFPTAYGVKIINADALGTSSGATAIKGLTIVSNQQVYIKGNYNTINKKPAAVLADAVNVLSSAVNEPLTATISTGKAVPTTVNAAFLSGIDVTTSSNYNGGLQNYIRFHENWDTVSMTYLGSFVSLGTSLHTQGKQSGTGVAGYYNAPNRNWGYDTDFNNATNLPPLTPRFVYLRQLLFARSW
ncbi:hypothetical protein GCM10022631_08450 [Deinococcus rubellus]|uniref:Pilus assembly PilX N-terminal domain-containing protein n=1 Tax=Deinococcus rubellus TaxID=1889240 RepID=A0ABY5YHG4_9DEIO|nr:pilus assembly PilX N-terminal domain-containing protein [Deinococcus rubellus]UWX64228.1 pilus assembly PilX N-terminal domain-containing protein [Deinococcus rubellus]